MKPLLMALLVITASGSALGASAQDPSERALIAYMKVKPGTERQFLDAANDVIAESQAESGNIIYYLHQSTKTPQQFVFYELFKTDADLQYHRNSKHVKAFLKKVDPIVVPGQFILEEYKYYSAP